MDYKMLVNKENPLPEDFVPIDLVEYTEENGPKIDSTHKTLLEKEAMKAFYEMKQSAREFGYDIIIDSGYRSYEYQQKVLDTFLNEIGDLAYSRVAPPGCSEHQTGLAIDVSFNIDGKYVNDFDDSFPQIKWLLENAYKFGFILRYPKGKENITGYNYENWHYRYVGKDLAMKMHLKNIETLEEYYEMFKEKKYT